MEQHQAGDQIGAVRIAKKCCAREIEPVALRGLADESSKGGRLGLDARLLEAGRRDPLEPAEAVLLRDTAARRDKGRIGRDPPRQRQQRRLFDAGSMQQKQAVAARISRPEESVRKGQIAMQDAGFSGIFGHAHILLIS